MKRLTTDNPKGNFDRLMNFAFAKDHKAILSYADGEENVELCSYVSKLANQKGIDLSPEEIMEDGLMDFADEDFAILYYCAVQAAEVRARLKMYEDKLENGTLIDLPCKVGDTVYAIPSLATFRLNVLHGLSENNRVCEQKVHSIQMWKPDEWCLWTCDGVNLLLQKYYKKTWFLTREEAEKALEELNNE